MSYLLAFAGFAALIILHEFGHFVAAKAVGMRVERFALFFPPLVARWRPRNSETEYGIGVIPLGGYVKITGMNPAEDIPPEVAHRAYFRQPVWKRVVVILAGPLVNIVLAFLILWIILWSTGKVEASRKVDRVTPGTPAASALVRGDTIVAVDGRGGSFESLRAQIAKHTCARRPATDGCVAATPARLAVRRGGRIETFALRPIYDAQEGQVIVGFAPGVRTTPIGPGAAAVNSLDAMWRVTSATATVLSRLFEAEQRKQLSGVVGNYERTRQAVDVSATRTLLLLALISLSLGLINLLPFLPLDGGHMFWALAEKISGRPISFGVMERASMVGIGLVIVLFAIGLQNDIGRLSGKGFGP